MVKRVIHRAGGAHGCSRGRVGRLNLPCSRFAMPISVVRDYSTGVKKNVVPDNFSRFLLGCVAFSGGASREFGSREGGHWLSLATRKLLFQRTPSFQNKVLAEVDRMHHPPSSIDESGRYNGRCSAVHQSLKRFNTTNWAPVYTFVRRNRGSKAGLLYCWLVSWRKSALQTQQQYSILMSALHTRLPATPGARTVPPYS